MQATALMAPLLPGKTEVDRAAMISCWRGERREPWSAPGDVRASLSRPFSIQPTPNGDIVVVYVEADNIKAAFKAMATSDDPFDQWFRDHTREVHGINLEDGFPPPEQIMDFRAEAP